MAQRVVYYHGCFVNYFDHETGFAVIIEPCRSNRNRRGRSGPTGEAFQGSILSFTSATLNNAKKRAAKLVNTLGAFASRGCHIVYSCPTCGYALKKIYPVLLETETSRLVADNTSFISAYLLGLRDRGKLNGELGKMPLRVSYHTPCHLRSNGLATASTKLLALIPEIDVRYIDRGCCGMGGTWGLRSKNHCELSGQVGAHVFEAIKEVNPQLVATDCAGCQIQIARYTGYADDKIRHPIRIFAEAYL